jgi:hypothetical protein
MSKTQEIWDKVNSDVDEFQAPLRARIAILEADLSRLRSCLMNARNVLRDGGYYYASRCDEVLEETDRTIGQPRYPAL